MKGKLFTLTLLLFVCAATARSQGPLLPKTVTPVNATSNVTENVTLDPAFLLSGTITGGSGSVPSVVLAVSTTPFVTFLGVIDQSTHTYRIVLPAGTYNLNVSFTDGGTSFTYTDSTPVTVSADTVRNIILPTVTTSTVTGTVSNLNASFPTRTMVFSSTTISGFSSVSAGAALDATDNYAVQLPNGTFMVQLLQQASSFVPPSFTTISQLITSLGSAAVTNPFNFSAPTITTATLSGTVSISGSATIPSSVLSFMDTSAPPPQTTSSGNESLASTGGYSLTFPTGDTYAVRLGASVQILPSPAPPAFFFSAAVPVPGTLTTNTTFNPNFPALPGPETGVTISGRVTITGTNTPVGKATVSAFEGQVTDEATTFFSRSTTADANGNYSLVVPAGTNYTLSVTGQFITSGDFDGDGKADNAVWRPSSGTWFVIPSNNPSNFLVQQWGVSTDIPVRGDFDGDGKTDFAVWRPSTGTWYVIPSKTPGNFLVQQWGLSGDIPVPGDYDGDGKTDFAVFRPSNGTWYTIPSSNPSSVIVQQWGMSGDIPVPGDYDGDGKTDFAVWRPSNGTWYVIPSSNPSNFMVQQWGVSTDIPTPVDYDGDRKTDFAVWRPSNGTWYVIPSSAPTNFAVTQWGVSTDVPVQKPVGQ